MNKSIEYLEKNIPQKREEIVEYILNNLDLQDPDLTHQNVKKFSDILSLMAEITETAEANKPLSVDLSSDDDIMIHDIFWTEERLNAIEDYILPDLKEYFEETKKKVLHQKLITLLTIRMQILKNNC